MKAGSRRVTWLPRRVCHESHHGQLSQRCSLRSLLRSRLSCVSPVDTHLKTLLSAFIQIFKCNVLVSLIHQQNSYNESKVNQLSKLVTLVKAAWMLTVKAHQIVSRDRSHIKSAQTTPASFIPLPSKPPLPPPSKLPPSSHSSLSSLGFRVLKWHNYRRGSSH